MYLELSDKVVAELNLELGVPQTQVYRVPVLLQNVTAPSLPPRGGKTVVKIRMKRS